MFGGDAPPTSSNVTLLNSLHFENTIKVGSLNVCGIKQRSNFPEFICLVNKYDILFVSETKLDQNDVILIKGYKFVNVYRKQKSLRKSGGLGVFVKEHIYHYIEIYETNNDYIFWLKLSNKYTYLAEDIIFGGVYIPPIHSRFYNEDEYELFVNEITTMCGNYLVFL